jgi:dopamine receptor D2
MIYTKTELFSFLPLIFAPHDDDDNDVYFTHVKALRTRARKQRAARKHNISDLTAGGSIIENIAQTKRLAETTMDGSSKSSKIVPEEERPTNTGSGSQDEDEAG